MIFIPSLPMRERNQKCIPFIPWSDFAVSSVMLTRLVNSAHPVHGEDLQGESRYQKPRRQWLRLLNEANFNGPFKSHCGPSHRLSKRVAKKHVAVIAL